jgi:hypothetical protein
MLAQNFKTAADLRIPDSWVDALVKVLGMLERGEIQKVALSNYQAPSRLKRSETPIGFNMRQFYARSECGTVCCLGGWAEYIGRLKTGTLIHGRLVTGREELDVLFDPSAYGHGLEPITTSQAAIALRNYLTHGEPRWGEALAG